MPRGLDSKTDWETNAPVYLPYFGCEYMGLDVKIMGAIDVIAAIVILLSEQWIGIDIIAFALLIKGFISLLS